MRSSIKINGIINTTGSINYVNGSKKPTSAEAYYESLSSVSSYYSSGSATLSNPVTIGNTRIDTIQNNPFNYKSSLFTNVNGKSIISTNTDLINVNQVLSDLSANNLATEAESINMASLNVLSALGCSVVVGNRNRNLLDERTYDAKINNVNIKNRRPLPNRRKSTNKSFPDVDDPFYKDDSGKQSQKTKEIQKAANTRNLVARESLPVASYLASSGLVPRYSNTKNYKASPIIKPKLTKDLK
jgi:hypothetical protein